MKKILIVLGIGFFCTLIINSYFASTEAALAKGVIRFHVIANSDSDEDQNLKLKVRDRIINEMNCMFDENGDITSARDVICANIDDIESYAMEEIKKNGYDYDVKVSLGKSDFPTKDYGDIVLPAGSYEALKVEIGKAEGKNWWCVLFPPLCFVDESAVSYSSSGAQKVVASVGQANADLVQKDKSPQVELKFKSYEMWQSGKQKLAFYLGMK